MHSEVEPQGDSLVAGSALTSLQVRDPALLNSLTAPGPPAYLCPPPPPNLLPLDACSCLFTVALGKGFHHQSGSLSLISDQSHNFLEDSGRG